MYTPGTGLASKDAYGALSIAVPSRVYYSTITENKPLSGKRLGVKEIYDLEAVRTSGGNRAYQDLTKPTLQTTLINSRRSNPRGVGYQSLQGSSARTSASIAPYKWTDIVIGSDTGDAVRLHDMANSLFGMRITNASMPLNGILPVSAIFDTTYALASSGVSEATPGCAQEVVPCQVILFLSVSQAPGITKRILASCQPEKHVPIRYIHVQASLVSITETRREVCWCDEVSRCS
ncbi:hypothetical protein BDU57DRAFT_532246 [Ampelomyces quisqualis]|uniref:Uncharacterized protein n=1 Tax=Ampelomyces quisqualis TaxID=50730 RepID=A0A6A5QF66_AMPQU|nr:hypothetical protein BDU57DRAFT_532246 [Ampelomyces quisqualis]